jgi:hypothetical protein
MRLGTQGFFETPGAREGALVQIRSALARTEEGSNP